VVRGTAGLHADFALPGAGVEFLHLAASKLAPQHRLLVLVNLMNLKDMFGRIQPDPDNRHSDGSSWLRLSQHHSLAHSIP
jgi:hypothetical protein